MKKKKQEHLHLHSDELHQKDLEVIKAAAQAWHSRSRSSTPSTEFNAHQRRFESKPSRFQVEAANKLPTNWDFSQSLWDSYEIVTTTKRLEAAGLASDDPFSELSKAHRKRRESKNSLRNLFNLTLSRRFNNSYVPGEASQ